MDWSDLGIEEEDDESERFEGAYIVRGKVVGVSFAKGYPENLIKLKEVMKGEGGPLVAEIRRNPKNPYDSNACEVWVKDVFIGHIARDLAAVVAPMIDEGLTPLLMITSIGFAKDDQTKPGAGFRLEIL